jgi:hypothetical protein
MRKKSAELLRTGLRLQYDFFTEIGTKITPQLREACHYLRLLFATKHRISLC